MIRNLLIATILLAAPAAFAQQAAPASAEKAPAFKAHVLSRVELDDLLKQPTQVLLIDVRRPDEVAGKGGFPVYLSVQINDLESSLAWIPKDRKIVTVSNHAARAGKAADLLAAKGYKVAGAVGVELYEKDGGTLTKIAIPPAPVDAAAATRSAKQ
jgi:rhodanese-related sulfurtransferase